MKDRSKHLSKRQRREEIMARANRARQSGGTGETLTGPQGVGEPRVTGPRQNVQATAGREERRREK
jgi:hypothetical protein